MASLDTLSDSEIRVRLTEYGYPVGPVTATTRKVMLKKLKSLMESGDGNRRQEPPSGSGEESDGGVSRGGLRSRRSMPPPKSPPRRKSPARARDPDVPLANSTALDDPPASTSFEETTSSTTRSRSPYVPSYAPMTSRFGLSEGFRSRLQSGDDFGTTLSSPSPLPSASISSVSPSPSYHPNQPYSSDLARRLSSLHSSRLSMVGSSVGKTMEARTDHIEHGGRQSIGGISSPISSKFLDVKESDDEDNGSVQGYAKFGQSGKGAAVMQARSSGRVAQDGWFSYDSPVSALLLVVFLLFFLAIGATYINMHSVDNAIAPGKHLSYVSCSAQNVPSNTDCIVDTDFPLAETVFWIVHDEFMERAAKMGCYELGDAGQLSDTEVANLVVAKNKTLDATDVQRSIPSVKVLVKANSNFRLFVTPSNAIALDDVPTTFTCYVIRKLVFAANWLMKLSIMTAALAFGYKGVSWWVSKNARYKEDVYRLVTNIVEIVSTKAQESPGGGYVPISHVRDQLIPPQDRQRLAKLWNDAVTMLESDSRLRSEVQLVEGEEFLVWRWLASPLAVNKRKVWQGQAFETVEGSVNSLPDSPTSCLKIRHMFDPAFEEGEDWVTTVADAILDKCGDARILHIVVDKLSREGCVYMKCASQRDAGIAYRALHGSWFDSKLVTVKYIREKRYLERFPDSAKSVLPLQPSNDKKNSLQ